MSAETDGGSPTAWAALTPPWRSAFDEAWASWCAGNFGIGAALHDPAIGEIVSTGRNRVTEQPTEPRRLAGNFMAHAEMNAFAAMPRWSAGGLHLYTTLEPCLMCAATAILLRVDTVHFAATDEFFAGLDDLWAGHEYTADRRPERRGPLEGRLRSFARLLPLTFITVSAPDGDVSRAAWATEPEVMALAGAVVVDGTLAAVRDAGGNTPAALTAVWERLPAPG